MLKKAFLIINFTIFLILAEDYSGIWGIGGISLGNLKSDKTVYQDITTSNGDTIIVDKLEPSAQLSPIFMAGFEKHLISFLSYRLGIGFERNGNIFEIKDGKQTSSTSSDVLYTWNHKRTLTFSYLTIPLDLKFKLPIRRAGLYAVTEAKIAFLLSAKDIYEHKVNIISPSNIDIDLPYDLPNESKNYEKNIKNDSRTVNVELGFKIGAEVPVRRFHLLIESGCDFGLIEVMEDQPLVERNTTFTILSLGLRLNTTSDE